MYSRDKSHLAHSSITHKASLILELILVLALLVLVPSLGLCMTQTITAEDIGTIDGLVFILGCLGLVFALFHV
jgi:hypothetical protein